jgi:hypothetical protein
MKHCEQRAVSAILGSLYLGPSFGVIQNTVGMRQRATAFSLRSASISGRRRISSWPPSASRS